MGNWHRQHIPWSRNIGEGVRRYKSQIWRTGRAHSCHLQGTVWITVQCGLRWLEKFSLLCLRDMGFSPSLADPCIWMSRVDDPYKYIAIYYVDDFAIASKDPAGIIWALSEVCSSNSRVILVPLNFTWDAASSVMKKVSCVLHLASTTLTRRW